MALARGGYGAGVASMRPYRPWASSSGPAARREHVDEALAPARHVVLPLLVLPGVGDVDASAEVLDAERPVVLRDRAIRESAGQRHRGEALVEHVDLPVVEVGRVEQEA